MGGRQWSLRQTRYNPFVLQVCSVLGTQGGGGGGGLVPQKILKATLQHQHSKTSAKHMIIIGLMKGLSLIGIGVIWLLSLVCLLMRTMTGFLHYTGYLNFIKEHVLLMKVLCYFWAACTFNFLSHYNIRYCQKVYERNSKIQVKYLTN